MARSTYVKCLARLHKPNGKDYWTCYKKKGHHLSVGGGREARKHVDNKQAPAYYWEADDACAIDGCIEPVDPYNPHNNADQTILCDMHWTYAGIERANLARKGVY